MWKELRIQSIINMFVNLFNLELINAKYRNYKYLAWKLNAQFYNNDLPVSIFTGQNHQKDLQK